MAASVGAIVANIYYAQPLLPGMIVSNEPGYYKTGAYGIRIENLIVVQPVEVGHDSELKSARGGSTECGVTRWSRSP